MACAASQRDARDDSADVGVSYIGFPGHAVASCVFDRDRIDHAVFLEVNFLESPSVLSGV